MGDNAAMLSRKLIRHVATGQAAAASLSDAAGQTLPGQRDHAGGEALSQRCEEVQSGNAPSQPPAPRVERQTCNRLESAATIPQCLLAGARRWLGAALLVTTLLNAPPALAWNAAGHRLSAIIAWQSLDPATREQLAELLRQHPDHSRWLARSRHFAPDLAAFIEASTWADELRRDPRFHETGEAPTPLLAGFPDMLRHRDWHYINRPLNGSRSRGRDDGELDRQLERLAHIVGDKGVEPGRRAWALPWLIHLVADAHQPLHVGSASDERGRADDGGNGLIVDNPFVARRHMGNLHRYWDDLPGPPWLRGASLEIAAQTLATRFPPPAPAGNITQWLDESWRAARDDAYPGDSTVPPTISAEFNERALRISGQRVAWSGYRLANLLQQKLRRR